MPCALLCTVGAAGGTGEAEDPFDPHLRGGLINLPSKCLPSLCVTVQAHAGGRVRMSWTYQVVYAQAFFVMMGHAPERWAG